MNSNPAELSAALLQWVKSFDFARGVRSFRHLQDGQILWKLLHEVDGEFFFEQLPRPDALRPEDRVPRLENLKHVDKHVNAFFRDVCNKPPEYTRALLVNLEAIAWEASEVDTAQLVKKVLLASFRNERMTTSLPSLGEEVVTPIFVFAQEVNTFETRLQQEADHAADGFSDISGVGTPDRTSSPRPTKNLRRDPELESEEKLYKAQAKIRELEAKNLRTAEELDRSQKQLMELDKEHAETKYRLENGDAVGASKDALERMRDKAASDSEAIASLETELESCREALETAEKELDRRKADADSAQKLRDELQMVRVERDELQQKAKANENLKKKIQTLQDSDKANNTLRQDYESLQENYKRLENIDEAYKKLRKTHNEILKTMANSEQEIFDQKTHRKRLEEMNRQGEREKKALKEQQQRDSETINELNERLRELGGSTRDEENLDDELETKVQSQDELKNEISALKAEISRLKQAPVVAPDTEDAVAREAYDQLQSNHQKLQQRFIEKYSESLGLDAALKEKEGADTQSQPFVELRDRLMMETTKLQETQNRASELETQLANLKAELQTADSKLASFDESEEKKVEELKRAHGLTTGILEAEKTRLVQNLSSLENELKEEKDLVRLALLSSITGLGEDQSLRSREEYKVIFAQLGQFKENAQPSQDQLAAQLAKRVEDARSNAQGIEDAVNQVRVEMGAQVDGLRLQLKKAQEDASKAVKSPVQENLQRELSLMTSAWYDITSRMQSDAVIVQRRVDMPRSFLNRQRRLLSSSSLPKRR